MKQGTRRQGAGGFFRAILRLWQIGFPKVSSTTQFKELPMPYVDGFVIPMPRKNLAAYRKIAAAAGKIWRQYGAIEYRECVGDDLKIKFGMPFPKLAKVKAGETVVFSWIVYKSKKQRDEVNAKIMKDPRIAKMMTGKPPFDMKRMSYGGFKVIVDA
jgi:uncharacterized protein YbaA (DUF1428 family)